MEQHSHDTPAGEAPGGAPGGAHPTHAHDGGLATDLPKMLGRRRALALLGTGLVALAGCAAPSEVGSSTSTTTGATDTGGRSASRSTSGSTTKAGGSASTTAVPSSSDASASGTQATAEIPDETAGPYPGDGSNGPDVLRESGVVRRDIRSSFAGASGTAEGVPTTLRFTVVELATGGPLAGAALYAWHCDAVGDYSMYSPGVTDQNWLRGVQVTDADGTVEFTTIFPGAYPGRWPHVHFEIYPDEAAATSGGRKLKTSQLAFPETSCQEAYTASGYQQSARNLGQMSIETDMVFRDGVSQQLATVTGNPTDGYTATLRLAV